MHTGIWTDLAGKSEIGMVRTVPEGMAPGSDTANLSVIGYDPRKYYSGRSPLEALSIGADMAATWMCLSGAILLLCRRRKTDMRTAISWITVPARSVPTEAAELMEALKSGLKREGYTFYTGTSYRHLLIQNKGKVVELTAPHDILTKRIGEYLPEDPVLREMMVKSYDILKDHPVNIKRREEGKNPANSAWFWGAGHPSGSYLLRREKRGERRHDFCGGPA